ncbi:MAG TPA: response regulator transcription factor [Thermomicrobiales bacterium]|nr:response regulator transcription factor [Thermomicrobiales bacterium]
MQSANRTGAAIRILLCEDQTLMRHGLRTILDLEPGITVVGEARDGHEAVAQARTLRPDVILMDVQMPGLTGIEATAAITHEVPGSHIIILTTFDHQQYLLDGLQAGAAGFLLKDAPADELIAAIQRVHAGESFVQPDMAARVLTQLGRRPATPEPETLTERETAILRLLAAGESNRAIADHLFLAEGTVKNYVSNILEKLNAANRTQAVAIARQKGLV